MRKLLTIVMFFAALSASADERGEKRLEQIAKHYSSLGRYAITFVMRAGDMVQSGTMLVDGKNTYLKIADMEVFVEDSLRYEVRSSAKEIIVDRADAYEKELLNSLNGFTHLAADYAIEECQIEGRTAVRFTPKKSGDAMYVITGEDGVSVAKLKYGAGENLVEVKVEKSEKSSQTLPRFSKERYKGFELIDFR
jgi:hypothetical protein